METKTDDESNELCGSQLLLDRPVMVILTINHTNTKSNAKINANKDRGATISTCPMKEIDNSHLV